MSESLPSIISNERFSVIYQVQGDEKDAFLKAEDICIEQSVEFPKSLLPKEEIFDFVIGKIEKFERINESQFRAEISFPLENGTTTLLELLNIVFGNISIKPDIKVEKLDLHGNIFNHFDGPKYGVNGLRRLFDAYSRPLLCTALKPIGLSSRELAQQAYQFAAGGIDIIKDDHGLANQKYSPFLERVKECAEAVAEANEKTGNKAIYMPCLNFPPNQIFEMAYFAKMVGSGGLLVMPGLVGFETMKSLSTDKFLDLPIFSHPSFLGSFTNCSTTGLSHYFLYGQLMRLSGADGVIYPNYGGRFSFSKEECDLIKNGCKDSLNNLKSIFPVPGGGMSVDKVPNILEFYGKDVVILIGGDLHQNGGNLRENSLKFRDLLEG